MEIKFLVLMQDEICKFMRNRKYYNEDDKFFFPFSLKKSFVLFFFVYVFWEEKKFLFKTLFLREKERKFLESFIKVL